MTIRKIPDDSRLAEVCPAVLVTGSSSGLGRALALGLSVWKCSLFLTGRNVSALESVRAECLARGAPRVEILDLDLGDPHARAKLWKAVVAFGGVEALINNAGSGLAGGFAETKLESELALVRLLIDCPLELGKRWLEFCLPRRRGWLLNIASTGAFQPGPYTSVYYAAKAFLRSWSEALRTELKGTGLLVTTAFPGALVTRFAERAGRATAPGARDPDFVAGRILSAWNQRKSFVIPGFREKILIAMSRWVPDAWSAAVVAGIQASLSRR